jgi:hypothetical protein
LSARDAATTPKDPNQQRKTQAYFFIKIAIRHPVANGFVLVSKTGSLFTAGGRVDLAMVGTFNVATFDVHDVFVVTGGTGRFAGATGNGAYDVPPPASFDPATGSGSGVELFQGTITLPRRDRRIEVAGKHDGSLSRVGLFHEESSHFVSGRAADRDLSSDAPPLVVGMAVSVLHAESDHDRRLPWRISSKRQPVWVDRPAAILEPRRRDRGHPSWVASSTAPPREAVAARRQSW